MIVSSCRPQPKTWIFTLLIFLSWGILSAQNSEIGLLLGGTAYRGDIEVRPSTALPQARPLAGVFYRYHPSNRWAFRGQLLFGQLHADEKRYPIDAADNFRQIRGVSFTTSMLELSILPELRLLSIGNVDFYAFGGVSGFYFNPTVDYNEPNAVIGDTNLDKNANFSKLSWAIPVGGGVQWFTNERFALGLEISGRKTFTDYLDGLSLAASPKVKDYCFFINLTASILLGTKQRGKFGRGRRNVNCPTFD